MPENTVRIPTWSGPGSGVSMSRISTRLGSTNTTAWVFMDRSPRRQPPVTKPVRNVGTISCQLRISDRRAQGATVEWYRQVQFVAAVPMPPEVAEAFGTTVNGMWADPERRTVDD